MILQHSGIEIGLGSSVNHLAGRAQLDQEQPNYAKEDRLDLAMRFPIGCCFPLKLAGS